MGTERRENNASSLFFQRISEKRKGLTGETILWNEPEREFARCGEGSCKP